MKKIEKGTYGYIRRMKLYTTIRTIVLFAMALGLYATGYVWTGTNKNLLTIVAILGLLPSAKSMVNMIMFLRFRSLDPSVFEKYEKIRGGLHILYENIMTTTKQAYLLDVLAYKNHTVCAFCEKAGDLAALEELILETLKAKNTGVTVKIFPDERAFMKRMETMEQMHAEEDDDKTADIVLSTIKALSL
ncbi:MAG: hypothetical protein J5518_07005 [Lachnospiraceae bacterium]|nr:hypothetical protein [Lachnospiraceae bacterium]